MSGIHSPTELGFAVPSWRPGQDDIIQNAVEKLDCYDTVAIDAPPGIGKSLIALAVARTLGARALIITGTKTLQDQYARHPTGLTTVKGRGNFDCQWVPAVTAAEAPCRFSFDCPKRGDGCDYFSQRDRAVAAPIAVANMALALADPNGSLLEDRDLLIVDEAHLLENHAADYLAIRLSLSSPYYPKLGLSAPPRSDNLGAYLAWAATCLSVLERVDGALRDRAARVDGRIEPSDLHSMRALGDLYETRIRLSSIDHSWTVERQGETVTFKATNLGPLLHEALWSHTPKRILMSGSFVDIGHYAVRLGIPDLGLVTVAPVIPPHRRPIKIKNVVAVNHRNADQAARILAAEIDKVIRLNPGSKGIVHTASFGLAEKIYQHLESNHLVFLHQRGGRERVIQEFRAAHGQAVLMSPSVGYGEDFPDDQARWQVIAKVPYPNLGSAWVKRKMELDPDWYAGQALQGIIQATGRIVRGPNDFGVTYILDSNVRRVLSQMGPATPRWFADGIQAGHAYPL